MKTGLRQEWVEVMEEMDGKGEDEVRRGELLEWKRWMGKGEDEVRRGELLEWKSEMEKRWGRQRSTEEALEVAECWTSRTDPLDVDVREGRKKSGKTKREGDEVKRKKCTTLLPLISPPVCTTADEAQRRFWSLSPTIPQLMTSCPVTRPTANPNRTRGKDEIAVGGLQPTLHKPTPRRAQQGGPNTDTAHLATCHVISAVAAILAECTRVGIVAVAHSMRWCCLMSTRTAGTLPSQSSQYHQTMAVLEGVRETLAGEGNLLNNTRAEQLDCSPFLNWSENDSPSENEKTIVFRSLIATVKSQPVFDVNLEAKAVEFITSATPQFTKSADAFLNSFGRDTADSLVNFVQSIGVLISSTSQVIITTAMKIIRILFWTCSTKVRLDLIKADLIPQLINILNPLSLSFTEAADIHVHLLRIIRISLRLAFTSGLTRLGIEDDDDKKDVYETILQHGVVPSEKNGPEPAIFSSLSPTTPQLMTSCPVTRPTANPNRTRGKDEIAVGGLQPTLHKPTPRRAQQGGPNTDTAHLATCHVISAVAAILAECTRVGIVAVAHSMRWCCLMSTRTAGTLPSQSSQYHQTMAVLEGVRETLAGEGNLLNNTRAEQHNRIGTGGVEWETGTKVDLYLQEASDLGAAESETGSSSHSDVWALGIVLHWLLFGEPPFKGQNPVKLIREISTFKATSIKNTSGEEERALLMRMLDPFLYSVQNPRTRVTSSQRCSFGLFRCLVNTPSGVWRLKDADDKEHSDKAKKAEKRHHSEKEKWKNQLEMEKNAHKQTADKLKDAENELRSKDREQNEKLEKERNAGRQEQEKVLHLEAELKTERSTNCSLKKELRKCHKTNIRWKETPHSSGLRSTATLASSPTTQPTVGRSQIGAAAIELFDQTRWTVSGNVFTKLKFADTSLVTFEFGAVVARLSLTIRKGPTCNLAVGMISSHAGSKTLPQYFPWLKGGAGWDLDPTRRYVMQREKMRNGGSACLEGREGQHGMTQPVFFTNIPVPFRFAVYFHQKNDAVEIESVEVVSEPQMVGGTIAFPMDEQSRTHKNTLSAARADLSSPQLPYSVDDGHFMNWSEDQSESVHEPAVVYRSLVATMKLQPELCVSLEAKAAKFLKSVNPQNRTSADAFVSSHGRTTGESLTNFIQSIVVLISSPHHAITTAVMKMLCNLIWSCTTKFRLALLKADLIPLIIISLNPQSLSFAETEELQINLMSSIECSLYLMTPHRHGKVEIDDDNERQAVYETVLQQVIVPSEKNRSEPATVSRRLWLLLDNKHCFRVIFVVSGITTRLYFPERFQFSLATLNGWSLSSPSPPLSPCSCLFSHASVARDINPVSTETVLFSDCCAPRHSPAIRHHQNCAHHSPAARLEHQHPHSLDCLPPLTIVVDSSERQTNRNTASSSPTNPFFSALSRLSSATDTLFEWNAISAHYFMTVCGGKSCGREGFGRKRQRPCSLASNSDNSLAVFVQSVVVLVSSTSQVIIKASMKMVEILTHNCSAQQRFALVKADLIPQLIISLDPQSLSFDEAVDIHIDLIHILTASFSFTFPDTLATLKIPDCDEQQSVHETVLHQVLIPSEKYICHLCVNRFSIIDHRLCESSLSLLTQLITISPKIPVFSRQSRSMVATLSFSSTATLALLVDGWLEGDDLWEFANNPSSTTVLDSSEKLALQHPSSSPPTKPSSFSTRREMKRDAKEEL
ncbi:hypothetical protein BLNAU_9789 [Blattamonas nauphoetae]|uniref:Protein kinase domain-containing protein n=1 Tax=Blattamonas nauphoetae TaxID=2049346 RepID=A0ABQ9XUS9_9EUKA|nr:hypothetical protein BLNAU_9789 [Blattamonas nauphoetae]